MQGMFPGPGNATQGTNNGGPSYGGPSCFIYMELDAAVKT